MCKEYPIDVVFLVDGSDSIVSNDFDVVKKWILDVADAFEPSEISGGLQINVVQYSDIAQIELKKLITKSSDEIKDQVLSIEQMKSGTKTYTALKYVNTEVHPHLRAASYKILITLTDGDASDKGNQQTVQEARVNFNKMMVVGISDRTDQVELLDFTSTGNVYSISNFQRLESTVMQIVDNICSGMIS